MGLVNRQWVVVELHGADFQLARFNFAGLIRHGPQSEVAVLHAAVLGQACGLQDQGLQSHRLELLIKTNDGKTDIMKSKTSKMGCKCNQLTLLPMPHS